MVHIYQSKSWNWDEVDDSEWEEPAQEVYKIINRWQSKGYKKILDLGCGIGRHSILLAKNGFDIQACDLSAQGIASLNKIINKNKLTIETLVTDMLNIPFKSEEFDAVVAFRSIYHTDDVGIRKVLDNIHRVLKTNGEALITFNSKNSWSFKNSNDFISPNTIIKMSGPEIGIPHFYADKMDILTLLEKFEIEKFWYTEEYFEKDMQTSHYFTLVKKVDKFK